MLRILENGYNVRLVEVKGKIQSVDTKEDLLKVNKILNNLSEKISSNRRSWFIGKHLTNKLFKKIV